MAEILAPAGGKEQLIAAVRSGCDAVYLGLGNFNARRNADNFDDDSLAETVMYCHSYGVKVHVALNTLVTDKEIGELADEIRTIALAGADAVIVQDIGVAKLVHQMVPDLPMHASTQLTVHNVSGVRQAKKLGFSRVVLSRELSFSEIETIRKNTDIELEVFVHGALCMCMSGACYLSSMLGGRSGNRGMCAQPCRLNFRYSDKEYALSLKDMSHICYLRDLERIGIESFKIEGRMKRPEYVAAAVKACRDSLRELKPDTEALQSVFSRQGFTDGYYTGRRTSEMFGHRVYEDVKAADSVLKALESLYSREPDKIPVRAVLSCSEGDRAVLTVTDGEYICSASGENTETADHEVNTEALRKSIGKMGNTPFFLEDAEIDIRGNPFISVSEINGLRRTALENLMEKRRETKEYSMKPFEVSGFDSHIASDKKLYVRCQSTEQAKTVSDADRIILPIDEVLKETDFSSEISEKLVCELPPVCFPDDEKIVSEQLSLCRENGITDVLADNIGMFYLGKKSGMTVHAGYGLNILNSVSLEEFDNLGAFSAVISFELNAQRIARLGGNIERGIIGYGYLPLMKTRACPLKGVSGCSKCPGRGTITDRLGKNFEYVCSSRKYGTLYNSVPLWIADRDIPGIDFELMMFTYESPERCRELYEMYKTRCEYDGERTNGLYFRDLI